MLFMLLIDGMQHGVDQLRVIGGAYDCCLRAGMQFYCGNNDVRKGGIYPTTPALYRSLRVAMHPVSKAEITEITKNLLKTVHFRNIPTILL